MRPIDLVITDVDGVLTDNRVWYSENGNKREWAFNQYDFEAFTMLTDSQLTHYMLSGAQSQAFMLRALHVGSIYRRAENKLEWFIDKFGPERLDTTAFIGNDTIDIPLLKAVGCKGCPRDAYRGVRSVVEQFDTGYVTQLKGGEGAFREFVDYLLLRF